LVSQDTITYYERKKHDEGWLDDISAKMAQSNGPPAGDVTNINTRKFFAIFNPVSQEYSFPLSPGQPPETKSLWL